jgi:hypothetical protein
MKNNTETVKDYSQTFFDESIRVDSIVWLDANHDQPCEALEEFIRDTDVKVLNEILGTSLVFNEDEMDEDEFSGRVLDAITRRRISGFLVLASTPVVTEFHESGHSSNGFGYYQSEWFLTKEFNQEFVDKLVAWKQSLHKKWRIKQKKEKA